MRRKGTACETAHCMVPAGGRDGEALDGAPEGAGGVVVRQAGVGVDVAGDVDGIGCGSEADDFGVEADRYVDVIFAGKEEKGVARRTELAVLLNGVDLVDLCLDIGGGHGGIEDKGVGTEIRLCRRPGGRRCESAQQNQSECKLHERGAMDWTDETALHGWVGRHRL